LPPASHILYNSEVSWGLIEAPGAPFLTHENGRPNRENQK
jgi:hypothetical protein